jgi:phasin family protein
MNMNVDQLSKATKTQVEAQLHTMSHLAEKALHSVSELAELNIATAKASLEEASAIVQEVMSAKDLQSFFVVVQSQEQPTAEKAVSYSRHLAAITSKAQADLTKAAQERVAEAAANMNTLVNDLTKAAPTGTESFVEAFKSNFANANAAYAKFLQASQSAYDKYQDQLHEMSNHFSPVPAAKPAKSKKAAA